jgi:hypothetical protein
LVLSLSFDISIGSEKIRQKALGKISANKKSPLFYQRASHSP